MSRPAAFLVLRCYRHGMKSRLILLLLAAHAGTALAQYKCTAANGAITFQQTPCFGAKTQEKLNVVPNGHPPAASGAAAPEVKAATSVDKRMLADYDKQREHEQFEQAVRSAQDDAAKRSAQRAADIAAAQRQAAATDPPNAQALNDALASIDRRYRALAELDDRRIKVAQAALAHWEQAQK
jgi:hypothetical protein